jgi:hypothetical protein
MRVTGVENTPDAMDVKAVLQRQPHSRNTIVGLSLLGLSPIFKGQHCSKKGNIGRLATGECERASSQQFTSSKEKIYRNLPISLGDSASVVGS